jgi:hypothetical protein
MTSLITSWLRRMSDSNNARDLYFIGHVKRGIYDLKYGSKGLGINNRNQAAIRS